jgi:hypothetical protein
MLRPCEAVQHGGAGLREREVSCLIRMHQGNSCLIRQASAFESASCEHTLPRRSCSS